MELNEVITDGFCNSSTVRPLSSTEDSLLLAKNVGSDLPEYQPACQYSEDQSCVVRGNEGQDDGNCVDHPQSLDASILHISAISVT